jgi:hypothetical protein
MKREYVTLTRKRCFECGERLEYITCWPQNFTLTDREGWGYWYCSDRSCKEHCRPKDQNDLDLGRNNPSPRRTDTFIEWDKIRL